MTIGVFLGTFSCCYIANGANLIQGNVLNNINCLTTPTNINNNSMESPSKQKWCNARGTKLVGNPEHKGNYT
jgi:hypothetical protein